MSCCRMPAASTVGSPRSEQVPYVAPRISLQKADFISSLYPQVPAASAEGSLLDTLKFAEQIAYPVAYPEIETATKPTLTPLTAAR